MSIQSTTLTERSLSSGQRTFSLALPAVVFLISLTIPFMISVGGLRLSPYRIVLIAMMPLLLARWLSGDVGRVRLADISVLMLCLWASLSFLVIHGAGDAVEAGGIFFVETMGAYLIGRCFVRSADEFRRFAKTLFWIVIFFMPFAIIEALSNRNLLLEVGQLLGAKPDFSKEPRWGMERVQASFEHPILFGVFCGSAIGLTHMVLGHGKSLLRRSGPTALVLLTAAFCLSAGPLTGMVAQLELIAWNTMLMRFKWRWFLLVAIIVAFTIVLEIFATRPAPAIFIDYFSFDEHNAYMRLHIWNFGTASIANNPVFGIGLNEWERPFWMSSSIDMFWIVHGVRHGVLAMALTLLTFFFVFLPLAFRSGLDDFHHSCRLGILFSLGGFFLMGWTVHFWNATYALFMFFLGSGVWLLDVDGEMENGAARPDKLEDKRASDMSASTFQRRRSVSANDETSRPSSSLKRPTRIVDYVFQRNRSADDNSHAYSACSDPDESQRKETPFSRSGTSSDRT